jgi:hypothetical protein
MGVFRAFLSVGETVALREGKRSAISLVVMPSALGNHDFPVRNRINDAVLGGDTPRPKPGQRMLKRFWLARPNEGVALNVANQLVQAF